jgi:PAS domain S-box-containing protein
MPDQSSAPDELALLQQIDATERRRAAERAAFFEIMGTVVEALPDALVITDEAGEIILVNAQAELIFGYHRDQMIGQVVEMLMPERFQQSHAAHRAEYLLEPRLRAMPDRREIIGRRRDGQEMSLAIMLSPVVTRSGIYTLAVVRRKRNG